MMFNPNIYYISWYKNNILYGTTKTISTNKLVKLIYELSEEYDIDIKCKKENIYNYLHQIAEELGYKKNR